MATEKFEEIAEDFDFLDDWEDRYRYVIELGKKMDPLDEAQKTETTKVRGCASQVWIVPRFEGGQVSFAGESDAMIVNGLIAVLLALYEGLTPEQALAVDAHREMGRLGLDQHLSAQRSNGLRAMIERIRQISAAAINT